MTIACVSIIAVLRVCVFLKREWCLSGKACGLLQAPSVGSGLTHSCALSRFGVQLTAQGSVSARLQRGLPQQPQLKLPSRGWLPRRLP